MPTRTVVEYVAQDGTSPFGRWFEGLDGAAAAKVATALYRMEQGNLSNSKMVGKGVWEYRIDFGPGYRIYYGHDGPLVIVLLCGGTKKRQELDIRAAQGRWADYRIRRSSGPRGGSL